MRFLIAFVAILGYASASAILGLNPGDVQAAVINANVAATDTARAIGEGQARAAEAAIQHNTEAVRQVAETNRNLHENAYWGNVAATQNLVAAAQSQVAGIDGSLAGARAALVGAPLAYAGAPLGYAGAHLGYAGAPLAYAGAPLAYAGAPLGLAAHGAYGIRAW